MTEKADRLSSTVSAMAGSRSAGIADQKIHSAAYYTAMVEDLTGQRSWLTLQITGRDPQGEFDWSCGHRGLKRVDDLEEHIAAPPGEDNEVVLATPVAAPDRTDYLTGFSQNRCLADI